MNRKYYNSTWSQLAFVAIVIFMLFASCTVAVDRNLFRRCDQDGFCRRNRNRFTQENPNPKHLSSFTTTKFESRSKDKMTMTAQLTETIPPLFEEKKAQDLWPSRVMKVSVRAYEGGVFRVTVDEASRSDNLSPRYSPEDVIVEKDLKQIPLTLSNDPSTGDQIFTVEGNLSDYKIVIPAAGKPFGFEMKLKKEIVVSATNLLFENHMKKPEPPKAEGPMPEDANEELPTKTDGDKRIDIDGAWEESFGGKTDSKPNGPGAVGLDVFFQGASAVYGVPEHASSMALQDTHTYYNEPYRLYNADVFKYELNETMALYGSIPFVVAHDCEQGTAVGMLWLNPSETWVDVNNGEKRSKELRWTSEDGLADVWLFVGPTAFDVFRQYTSVTGRPFLPPLFSTAYHQCRWNYNDQDDVHNVDEGFDKHNIPYDVIWLDIEHTDGKKYFTWDSDKFSQPEVMQKNLSAKGRKLVTIVDPHIKRDSSYDLHKEAAEKHYYVLQPDGTRDFEGHCWPGTSSWIDFMNPDARTWWASKFGLDQYRGSSENLFIWNDMNEPAIFGGAETSMLRDAKHYNNLEHRQVHNMYGHTHVMATNEGLCRRVENQRPFVLTRSFFAGTQKHAAVWTGDNQAKWEYLQQMIPMVLSLNLAGIVFSGADVAGFFDNPSEELLVRWYQAGTFTPFFRAHAHLETKRREPWLFSPETTNLIREAVVRRYRLMPYVYTTFREASVSGAPVARALWTVFPNDKFVDTMDDEYMFGPALLVHPVTSEGAKSVKVYLPAGLWYDFDTYEAKSGSRSIEVETPLNKVPVFFRGGSIVPTRQRQRRSTTQQENDPFTLIIAPDDSNQAEGDLYLDDGKTFDYQKKEAYDLIHYQFKNSVLKSKVITKAYDVSVGIERIVFLNIKKKPAYVVIKSATDEHEVPFTYDNKVLTLKKPVSSVLDDWKILIL